MDKASVDRLAGEEDSVHTTIRSENFLAGKTPWFPLEQVKDILSKLGVNAPKCYLQVSYLRILYVRLFDARA